MLKQTESACHCRAASCLKKLCRRRQNPGRSPNVPGRCRAPTAPCRQSCMRCGGTSGQFMQRTAAAKVSSSGGGSSSGSGDGRQQQRRRCLPGCCCCRCCCCCWDHECSPKPLAAVGVEVWDATPWVISLPHTRNCIEVRPPACFGKQAVTFCCNAGRGAARRVGDGGRWRRAAAAAAAAAAHLLLTGGRSEGKSGGRLDVSVAAVDGSPGCCTSASAQPASAVRTAITQAQGLMTATQKKRNDRWAQRDEDGCLFWLRCRRRRAYLRPCTTAVVPCSTLPADGSRLPCSTFPSRVQ